MENASCIRRSNSWGSCLGDPLLCDPSIKQKEQTRGPAAILRKIQLLIKRRGETNPVPQDKILTRLKCLLGSRDRYVRIFSSLPGNEPLEERVQALRDAHSQLTQDHTQLLRRIFADMQEIDELRLRIQTLTLENEQMTRSHIDLLRAKFLDIEKIGSLEKEVRSLSASPKCSKQH